MLNTLEQQKEREREEPYLRRLEHFAQGPHEGTVDPHELLLVHLVGLIQHHPHLVIVPSQRADHLSHTHTHIG